MIASASRYCRRRDNHALAGNTLVVAGGVFLHLGRLGADRQLRVLAVAGHVGVAAQWTVAWKAVGQQHDLSSARALLACTPAAIPRLVLLVRAWGSEPFHAPAQSAAVVRVPNWMRQAGTAVATAMSVRLTEIRREELLVAQNSSVMPPAGWAPYSTRSGHSTLLMSQNRHSGPLGTRLGGSVAMSGGASAIRPWPRGYPACHPVQLIRDNAPFPCWRNRPASVAATRYGSQRCRWIHQGGASQQRNRAGSHGGGTSGRRSVAGLVKSPQRAASRWARWSR